MSKVWMMLKLAASFRSFSSSTLLKANRPSCTLGNSRFIDALEHQSVVGFPHCRSFCYPSLRRQWNPLPIPLLTSHQTNKEFDEWLVESGEEGDAMVKKFEEWMLQIRRVYRDGKEKIKRYLIFKETVEWVEAYNQNESKKTGMTMGLNSYSDVTFEEFVTMNKGNFKSKSKFRSRNRRSRSSSCC